ncbi:MAG TPA: CDP-alcohol phosphatidyltransferase family protein [bacterium (Candidatus Stahlbacteria)]|nr:CDP-alcohol phosphatidyltransferase family protein [Candidatus Stahlbacteria bacterium]
MRNDAFYLAPVSLFEKMKVHPIFLTIIGAVTTGSAGYLFARGEFLIAVLIMGIGSLFDLFDGELARRTNQVTPLGGFIDSNLDRVSELAIFLGLFSYYQGIMRVVTFTGFAFSQLVSYARARAEGVGINCQGGIFTRGVRFILLFIGGVFGPVYMRYILIIIMFGTIITFIQRIWIVASQQQ